MEKGLEGDFGEAIRKLKIKRQKAKVHSKNINLENTLWLDIIAGS